MMQMNWDIEGIDMSTAFLRTLPTEEEKRLWTTGVDELEDVLKVPRNSVAPHIQKLLWFHNGN